MDTLQRRIEVVCRRFADHTLLRDDAVALTGEALGNAIAELRPRIERQAAEGGRVGVLFFNSVPRAVAILAVLAARRVPVILDSGEPFGRFRGKSTSLKLGGLLASAEDFPDLPLPASTIFLDASARSVREEWRADPVPPPPPAGTGLILYTSGSTGERKGVLVPEAGILYTVDHLIRYFSLDGDTRASVILPLCHSMGLNTQFFPTFFAGGECTFIDSSLALNRCYRSLLSAQTTFASLISEVLLICAEERSRRGLPPAPTVRHLQLAGGVIRKEHLMVARDLFPNALLHKGYGLTEGIRVSMISSLDPHFYFDTAGYSLPGQEVAIRAVQGNEVGTRTLGQIFVKGPNVMLGYDNVAASPVGADGFLATGDLGHFTDGNRLVVHGRKDSVFKVAGDWVSGMEMERIVSEATSSVRDVKCIPVPDPKLGHRVVLFLEVGAHQKEDFLSSETSFLEQTLSRHFPRLSLPREVFILEKFPRTGNGKLQNHVLAGLLTRHSTHEQAMARNSGFRYRLISSAEKFSGAEI